MIEQYEIRLVMTWRAEADRISSIAPDVFQDADLIVLQRASTLRQCADDLETTVSRASEEVGR
jgi:prophage DNA circulation protein